MKYVVDTSVLVEKEVTKFVASKKIKDTVVVPRVVVAELENQANTGRQIGFLGLEEIQALQELAKKKKIKLEIVGERPSLADIKGAKRGGMIDSMIIDFAFSLKATLVTADMVQAESAKALGLKVLYVEKDFKEGLSVEKYFDETTMSVHLKSGTYVSAKKGKPGQWRLEQVSEERLSEKEVDVYAKEIIEKSRKAENAFIEISRRSSTIVQYQSYRIIIVRPPVADGYEITVVKPLVKLELDYYKVPEKVMSRLKESSSGIVIGGAVGSGKSTFAQALAEYYVKDNKITKTIESPRDMVLSPEITQYSKNFGSGEEVHDILFLSRPDNVIFDEMRDTPDFKLYTDIRLGGSSVIGVLHAATPIDAIQRFIGRMDTGRIPSVLDTILFIDKGNIGKGLVLKMVVKVPSGMTEADLARPVVEVRDLLTDALEFEIYSYGEQTVVIPVTSTGTKKSAMHSFAEKQLQKELGKYGDVEFVNEHKVRVYVPEGKKGKMIGAKGVNISKIEKKLGVSIDVVEHKEERVKKRKVSYQIRERGNTFIFNLGVSGKEVDFFHGDEYLFTSTSGKRGEVKLNKKSDVGKRIRELLDDGEKIVVRG
jgi:ATPase